MFTRSSCGMAGVFLLSASLVHAGMFNCTNGAGAGAVSCVGGPVGCVFPTLAGTLCNSDGWVWNCYCASLWDASGAKWICNCQT